MLKIIEARGNYYDCGYQFGEQAKKHIEYRLKREVKDALFKKYQKALEEVHQTCKKYYPQFIREMEGMADGAKVDYWRLLLLNTPEIESRKGGCTTIAAKRDDGIFLVHNEDGGGDERSQDCFLVHYVLPEVSFYAFVYAGEIPSGSYSWNSYGVYFSVNYLEPIRPDITDRVSRCFVARRLIEAKSIEDGISKLKSGHEASGYHYYLGKGTDLFSIEQFHDSVSIKEVRGIDVHTNHYLHPMFSAQAPTYKNSLIRYKQTLKLLEEKKDPMDILADRKHAPNSICTKLLENGHTISTIRFLPTENKVELYEPLSMKKVQTFSL